MPAHLIFRAMSATMAVLLLLSTVVQFNDPDALRWIALYGTAAAAAALALAGRLPRWLAPVTAAVAIIWLATIAGPAWRAISVTGAALTELTMRDINVELAREAGGLLLVAGCMMVLTIWRPVRRQ